jgi:hypothetical protein
MELLLNLLWVLIALATFVWWHRRVAATRRSLGRKWARAVEMAALISALAILFPVISLTDDLHAEQFVMEDSNASRKNLKRFTAGGGASVVKLHHQPAILFSALTPSGAAVFLEKATCLVCSLLPILGLNHYQSRAPPPPQS